MKVLLPVYRELHDNVIVTLSSDISMRCGEDDDSRYRPAFYSDCRSQPARLTVTDIRAHHAAHVIGGSPPLGPTVCGLLTPQSREKLRCPTSCYIRSISIAVVTSTANTMILGRIPKGVTEPSQTSGRVPCRWWPSRSKARSAMDHSVPVVLKCGALGPLEG